MRKFVALAVMIGTLSQPPWAEQASDAQIAHFLNRASFGPAPGDTDAVRRVGIDYYLEQQLYPASSPKNPAFKKRLNEGQLWEGRDLAVTTDFRSVIGAVAVGQFGLDNQSLAQIIPGFKPDSGLRGMIV